MADHAIIISAEGAVSLAATTTAINTALAAEIVAFAPAPMQCISSGVGVAVGPIYVQSVLVKGQG